MTTTTTTTKTKIVNYPTKTGWYVVEMGLYEGPFRTERAARREADRSNAELEAEIGETWGDGCASVVYCGKDGIIA